MSKIFTVLSNDAEAKSGCVECQATDMTELECADRVLMRLQSVALKIFTVLSPDAEAKSSFAGCQETQ